MRKAEFNVEENPRKIEHFNEHVPTSKSHFDELSESDKVKPIKKLLNNV